MNENRSIMKKVTIIFPGWIKAPNGAAQFVFGLRSCINDFANQGIGLSTFTLDDVHGEVRNFSNNDKIKRKASLKNKLMRYAKYSHLMTYAMIYFSGLRYSKRIVEAFDEIPNDELPDIIHFQDLFACYYYLKRKRKNKKSVYLTLHSNGSLWSMYEEYYPLFRSCFFGIMKRRIEDVVLNRVDKVNFVADFPRWNFCHLYPHISSQKTSFTYDTYNQKDNIDTAAAVGNVVGVLQGQDVRLEHQRLDLGQHRGEQVGDGKPKVHADIAGNPARERRVKAVVNGEGERQGPQNRQHD